jgi:hypothetical protein
MTKAKYLQDFQKEQDRAHLSYAHSPDNTFTSSGLAHDIAFAAVRYFSQSMQFR